MPLGCWSSEGNGFAVVRRYIGDGGGADVHGVAGRSEAGAANRDQVPFANEVVGIEEQDRDGPWLGRGDCERNRIGEDSLPRRNREPIYGGWEGGGTEVGSAHRGGTVVYVNVIKRDRNAVFVDFDLAWGQLIFWIEVGT